jgi:phage replication-related protein YjqB (UPF0714/DUF867 family)
MNIFAVKIERAIAPEQQDLIDRPSHCSADPRALVSIGRSAGQQVRVWRTGAPSDFVLCTVTQSRSESPQNIVRMGQKGRERLGASGPFEATIGATVPAPDLTDEQARAAGEFVERLTDDGHHRGLIAIAPHGGQIEPHTDVQAVRVAAQLDEYGVSSWRCLGFAQPGSTAASRLHITSSDIHETSFPLLHQVMARRFHYAVSFHGFREDHVLVGGRAPFLLKAEIARSIESALAGSGIRVRIALPDDALSGASPGNIVNRLSRGGRNGVQIEQSMAARTEYGADIADAVAESLAVRLERHHLEHHQTGESTE